MSAPRPAEESPSRSDRMSWLRLQFSLRKNWLSDSGYLAWALVFWNVRKSWFVMRGRRGAGPCHDRSDSGRPGETHCVPAQGLHQPARFRRVCPLLKETKDGWRCSVAPVGVRPFWSRALLVYGITGAALYLSAAAIALQVFHRIGYQRLAYKDVVWPGHWNRFHLAQSSYFREQGVRAFQRGEYGPAMLSLSTAWQIDPGDYETGLLLAQLWAHRGGYGYSDTIFAQLFRDFPGQANRTALVYHDLLLGAQRFRTLAELCLARLAVETDRRPLYENSFYYALEQGRIAGKFAEEHAEQLTRLPPRVALLARVYVLWQQGNIAEARELLRPRRDTADGVIFLRLQVEALARLGATSEATQLLNHYARTLGLFEQAALQYYITAQSGQLDFRLSDFRLMLRRPLNPREFDRACALLIRTGDQNSLRLLPEFLGFDPLKSSPESATALWTAALVLKEQDVARRAAARLAELRRTDLPAINSINFLTLNPADPRSVPYLINVVRLPRETIYALVAESARRRAVFAAKSRGGN
jgi:hypothetical protein